MRFRLTLRPHTPRQKLTLNYNYPFSSWIYSRIKESDADYAYFSHQQGYQVEDSSCYYACFFSQSHLTGIETLLKLTTLKKGTPYTNA